MNNNRESALAQVVEMFKSLVPCIPTPKGLEDGQRNIIYRINKRHAAMLSGGIASMLLAVKKVDANREGNSVDIRPLVDSANDATLIIDEILKDSCKDRLIFNNWPDRDGAPKFRLTPTWILINPIDLLNNIHAADVYKSLSWDEYVAPEIADINSIKEPILVEEFTLKISFHNKNGLPGIEINTESYQPSNHSDTHDPVYYNPDHVLSALVHGLAYKYIIELSCGDVNNIDEFIQYVTEELKQSIIDWTKAKER